MPVTQEQDAATEAAIMAWLFSAPPRPPMVLTLELDDETERAIALNPVDFAPPAEA